MAGRDSSSPSPAPLRGGEEVDGQIQRQRAGWLPQWALPRKDRQALKQPPRRPHLSRPASMRDTEASTYAPCASSPPARLPARECPSGAPPPPSALLSQEAALLVEPPRECMRARRLRAPGPESSSR